MTQLLHVAHETPVSGAVSRPLELEHILAKELSASAMRFFSQRESTLGVGTISAHAMSIVHELLTTLQIPWSILHHTPSLTACDKQTIVAQHNISLLVNKTLSVSIGNTLVLITGMGDFTLRKVQITELGKQLGLSSNQRNRIEINPRWFSPEEHLCLRTGMVSPLFSMQQVHTPSLLHALAFLSSERTLPHMNIALSLSLEESLIVPVCAFQPLLSCFAQQAYPDLPLLSLST